MIGELRPRVAERRAARRAHHHVRAHEVPEDVGPERARERAEVRFEAFAQPGEVSVGVDRDALDRPDTPVVAQQRGERSPVCIPRRDESLGDAVRVADEE